MGGRSVAHDATPFLIPVLRWPSSVFMERQSHDFQIGVVFDQPLHGSLRLRHVHPDILS